jgi:hypothetical protein
MGRLSGDADFCWWFCWRWWVDFGRSGDGKRMTQPFPSRPCPVDSERPHVTLTFLDPSPFSPFSSLGSSAGIFSARQHHLGFTLRTPPPLLAIQRLWIPFVKLPNILGPINSPLLYLPHNPPRSPLCFVRGSGNTGRDKRRGAAGNGSPCDIPGKRGVEGGQFMESTEGCWGVWEEGV